METGRTVTSPDGYCTVLARLGSRGSRCVPSARSPAQFIRVSPDCMYCHRGRQLHLSDDIFNSQRGLDPGPMQQWPRPRIPRPEPNELSFSPPPGQTGPLQSSQARAQPSRPMGTASHREQLGVHLHRCSQFLLPSARLCSWLMEPVLLENRYQGLAKPSQPSAGYGNDIY